MKEQEQEQFQLDKTTEEKIKIAAEKLFMEKGFSGTRTRDIADEAGINLALLNYYYRSKKNLFNIIIMEKLEMFIDLMIDTLKDDTYDFSGKISSMVNKYTDLLTRNPRLSIFLVSELQQNPDFFISKLNIRSKTKDLIIAGDNEEYEMQLLLSFMGLTFFPFIVRDALEKVYNFSPERYEEVLNRRRELIPKWIEGTLKNGWKTA